MHTKRTNQLSYTDVRKVKFVLNLKPNEFSFRLVVCAILGIGMTAIILRHQTSPLALMMVLLSVVLISLLMWVFYPSLKQMAVGWGMLMSWLIGMVVCVTVYMMMPYMAYVNQELTFLLIDYENTRIYLWIMGSFVVPLALGMEQLIFARVEVITLARENEVAELDFRIRPHFIFNSLNGVASLIVVDPDQAEEYLMDLADIIRIILTEKRRLVPFHLEMDVAKKYMKIEEMRLGDRLQVVWQIDDLNDEVLLPTLSLQPLLENAVYHGVESRIKGGKVVISAHQDEQYFYLSVTNPVHEEGGPHHEGNQIALENLNRRFQYLYQGDAFIGNSKTSMDYTVNIKVPIYFNASNLPQYPKDILPQY